MSKIDFKIKDEREKKDEAKKRRDDFVGNIKSGRIKGNDGFVIVNESINDSIEESEEWPPPSDDKKKKK